MHFAFRTFRYAGPSYIMSNKNINDLSQKERKKFTAKFEKYLLHEALFKEVRDEKGQLIEAGYRITTLDLKDLLGSLSPNEEIEFEADLEKIIDICDNIETIDFKITNPINVRKKSNM